MEQPTWKNTMCCYTPSSMSGMAMSARNIGYTYFVWNERVLSSSIQSDSPMFRVGKSCDNPICLAIELDQPEGVIWANGTRPILENAKLIAISRRKTDMPLYEDIITSMIVALQCIMRNEISESRDCLHTVLTTIDNMKLRGPDPDASIAVHIAQIRVGIVESLKLCSV